MFTALIIEDVHETALWLTKVLGVAFPAIQTHVCPTYADSVHFVKIHPVSLALVDINLPDGNGIELVGLIRYQSPKAYIVVSTIFDEDEYIMQALRSGANGYLLKDSSESVFIHKLRGILTGDPPLSPSIARKILHSFAHAKQPVAGHLAEMSVLSQRERDVLLLVAKGYTRKEVAKLLDLSSNTIARYTRDVYQKLNISSRAEAAVEACRMGLVSTDN